jgi:hypothetical protein
MRIRGAARLALAVTFVASMPGAPAHAAIPCPPPDAALTASPVRSRADLPSLYRNDPDGFTTITAFIDDPADANAPVNLPPEYAAAGAGAVAPGTPRPPDTDYGLWYHNWSEAPNITTVGVWATRPTSKVRLPVFAIENLGDSLPNIEAALAARAVTEALHHAFTTAPFLWNMLLVGPDGFLAMAQYAGNTGNPYVALAGALGGGLAYGLGVIIASYFLTLYPPPVGWDSYPPVYVWTLYKNAAGRQAWGGSVVRQSSRYEWGFDKDPRGGYGGHGCKRTRIDMVTRDETAAIAHAGVFIDEDATGRCDGFCLDPRVSGGRAKFDATETFTSGVSVEGVDVPLLVVQQTEHKEGSQAMLLYPDYQRENLKIGLSVNGAFVPLIGAQFEAWHGAPPQRQRRLISIGAYDPFGAYHPAAGTRMTFERNTSDVWAFVVAFDGIGTRNAGDAMFDFGIFDPSANFVPVLGTKYDDDFAGHRFNYRAMISTGPYAGAQWEPALAVTYDGEQTLTMWAGADASNDYAKMNQWYVAAGAFNPAIGYKPVVGAHYEKGAGAPVVERYQLGVFPADYATFVPLAEARWSSSVTSAMWVQLFAVNDTRAPRSARADVGPVSPVGGFVPVAGAQITAGAPDRYGVGVWAANSFTPVIEACYSPLIHVPIGADPVVGAVPVPGMPSVRDGGVGVAAGGGSGRIPLLWIGNKGGPSAAAAQDCPG